MIIHGRIYQDITPLENIELIDEISELSSAFKYEFGGIANIIGAVKHSKIIIYGEKRSYNQIQKEFRQVEHYNTHDIKAIILKVKTKNSRLSIIETKKIKDEDLNNYYLESQMEVLMYLESIPRKFIPRDDNSILISIYNGGRDLINEKIFLSNLYNSKILISSKDSYKNLIKNKICHNEVIENIPIVILHSPESYEIKYMDEKVFIENAFFDKNKKSHFVGLGDKFSTILCESLKKEKIFDISHIKYCVNLTAEKMCEFLK